MTILIMEVFVTIAIIVTVIMMSYRKNSIERKRKYIRIKSFFMINPSKSYQKKIIIKTMGNKTPFTDRYPSNG